MCLCVITLGNLLECWLCENVNLVLLWMSSMLGTRWQGMAVFLRELLNQISVKRLIFCKSDTSSSESTWQNSGVTALLLQPLVAKGELQCDLRQHQKWSVKQKSLISTPGRISLNSVLLLLLVNFVSGFCLELTYILIISTRSSLIHLHGFQLLVLPYFIGIIHRNLFVCTNRRNLLNLK